MNQPNGIPNWLLTPLLSLEQAHPGVLASFLKAPAPRRNLIAAVIAVHTEIDKPLQLQAAAELATLIKHVKTRRIARAYMACEIAGTFSSLVMKDAGHIKERVFYRTLRTWLEKGQSPRNLKALAHSQNFSLATLQVLDLLDPVAIMPVTLTFVRNAHQARIFNAHLRFVRSVCGLNSDHELQTHIKILGRDYAVAFREFDGGANSWFNKPNDLPDRLIKRAKFPAPPFPTDSRLIPIASASKMVETALRYRNCLRRHIIDVVTGDRYYAFYRNSSPAYPILEFINDRPVGWRLASINGIEEEEVAVEAAAEIIADIERLGIPYIPSWQTDLLDDVDSWRGSSFWRSWDEASLKTDHRSIGVI